MAGIRPILQLVIRPLALSALLISLSGCASRTYNVRADAIILE